METQAPSNDPMRWVVGVGLRGHSVGAVKFGRWLQSRPGGDSDEFDVVHTVSDFEVVHLAERAVEETVAEHGLQGPHVQPHVQDHGDPVTAVADSFAGLDAHAVIVGRRAPTNGGGWPRLGRNGRRLLRSHPGPVIVVPPDWSAEAVGDGPLLLASDLGADSVEALRFTLQLASILDRDWVLAHVVPPPAPFTMYGLGAQPDESETRRQQAREQAIAYVEAIDAEPGDIRIPQGEVVDALLDLQEELGAAVLVTGSRRLSVLGRLFSASVGSELASAAACPVAVVPPDTHETAKT